MKKTDNKEKSRMRDGVLRLFHYWKKYTKPDYYNVVTLPGESFEFELNALEQEDEKGKEAIDKESE